MGNLAEKHDEDSNAQLADALKMPVHVPLRGDDGDASSSVSEGEVRGE